MQFSPLCPVDLGGNNGGNELSDRSISDSAIEAPVPGFGLMEDPLSSIPTGKVSKGET